ncbi:MAG: DUF3006 domain-containing protein [Candidatus Berkelbacteria bacterium]|nr:DUF3006 domain-containing protein [Candidatus Berkelbacteria bacterium]
MKLDKDRQQTKLSLDRFEEDQAVLVSDKDETMIVPKAFLPKSAKEGEVLVVTFATEAAETKQRETKAKEILNEILKIS